MKNIWIAAMVAAACTASLAKIPPPVLDDAAKAKAAEAAARTAWQGKVDTFKLCQAQDKVVAHYRKTAGSAKAMPVSMTAGSQPAAAIPPKPAAPAAAAAPAATSPGAAAPAGTAAATPAPPGAPAAPTPAAAVPPTPCGDPGPFAVNAPAEKPLETSGAHSPAGTATSPPSVRSNSAEMAPAKK